jgi:hypothetical protein
MTRKEAIITGMAGLSALAMAAPAARAEDSKEANPEVEKIRALLKAHVVRSPATRPSSKAEGGPHRAAVENYRSPTPVA